MKRRLAIVLVLCALILAGLLLLARGTVPALQVRIVDETGTPVAGAVIRPDGIRGTDTAHYGWATNFAVKPLPVTSDSQGGAAIPFPRFIVERVRSVELSFGVDHPDFAHARPFVQVATPLRSTTPFVERFAFLFEEFRLRGRVETITLKRAGALELTATLGGRQLPATDFHAQLASANGIFNSSFQRDGNRLYTKRVPIGDFIVRAVCVLSGTNYFSEVKSLVSNKGETNSLNLTLAPGRNLTGRIENVDGPVTNGWVNIRVVNHSPRVTGSGELITWADFVEIKPTGDFVVRGLPEGSLECVALCDGFLSENPPGARYSVQPRVFDFPATSDIILPMRGSSAASIRVLNPEGKPLAGASVHFWPNIQWAKYWSTIFASDFSRDAEVLGQEQPWLSRQSKRVFTRTTDANGTALIRELPPGSTEYLVEHDSFELPMNSFTRRYLPLKLLPGETNFAAIRLEKKGRPRD